MGEWIFGLVALSWIACNYYFVIHAEGANIQGFWPGNILFFVIALPLFIGISLAYGYPAIACGIWFVFVLDAYVAWVFVLMIDWRDLLPSIYYFLAIFGGVVLIGFTILNADELSSTEIGAWIGYAVGFVLSMFTVGRVVELLGQRR
jgi:hypothetical protein